MTERALTSVCVCVCVLPEQIASPKANPAGQLIIHTPIFQTKMDLEAERGSPSRQAHRSSSLLQDTAPEKQARYYKETILYNDLKLHLEILLKDVTS